MPGSRVFLRIGRPLHHICCTPLSASPVAPGWRLLDTLDRTRWDPHRDHDDWRGTIQGEIKIAMKNPTESVLSSPQCERRPRQTHPVAGMSWLHAIFGLVVLARCEAISGFRNSQSA